jgi:uncharacterized protein (TIGR00297 family)
VSGPAGAEIARKLLHMAVGGLAFAIRPLGFWGSLAVALAAVVHNAFLFPLYGGRRLWRTAEAERGGAPGIVLYPIAVTLLVVCFAGRLEVAAAAWGILAFGDGMAAVAGGALGRGNPLPWNPRKSWAGTLAGFASGTAGAAALLLWTAPGRYPAGFAVAVAAVAALVAALLESAPQGLDDNLGVPLVTGLLLYCLLLTEGHWGALATPEFGRRAVVGLTVNAALAIAAFAARGVDRAGALAGILLGTALWAGLDWRGFLLLFAFFALGTLATRVGYEEKAKRGIAQEKGGRRGARNAFAKTAVPALAALFAATTGHPGLFALAVAGAFATAASDTCASEIGQVYGRRTFLITSFEPVPRGTEGAVSLAGTLAGIAASLVVGVVGAAAGLYPWPGLVPVAGAALAATTLESLIGATLERRGLLDNEAVNFLGSLAGALIAVALGALLPA